MDKMIKGTETEKSLLKAFAGESQAKNRYTFFSEIAKAEAADGEHDEAFNLYPAFGKIAEEEGFKKVAATFKYVTEVEKMHEQRYLKLLQNIRDNLVFSRPEEVRWYCRKCGYVHVGKTPPEICPSCLHPKGYFELFPDNY